MPRNNAKRATGFSGGDVFRIPLTIKDETSHESITETSAFVRSRRDNSSNGVLLTVLCADGCFHKVISGDEMVQFRKDSLAKDFPDDTWGDVLLGVLSGERASDAQDLEAVGELATSNKYNPETGELKQDQELGLSQFKLLIQKRKKVIINVGEIPFEPVDEGDQRLPSTFDEKELNFLNWVNFLAVQNEQLKQNSEALQAQVRQLETERDFNAKELENNASEHDEIIKDLQDRFYQVLNSKKNKIWELQGKNSDDLKYLNQKYIAENKNNFNHGAIKREDIPDDIGEEYKKPPSKKRSTRSSAKREHDKSPSADTTTRARLSRNSGGNAKRTKVKTEPSDGSNDQSMASDEAILSSVISNGMEIDDPGAFDNKQLDTESDNGSGTPNDEDDDVSSMAEAIDSSTTGEAKEQSEKLAHNSKSSPQHDATGSGTENEGGSNERSTDDQGEVKVKIEDEGDEALASGGVEDDPSQADANVSEQTGSKRDKESDADTDDGKRDKSDADTDYGERDKQSDVDTDDGKRDKESDADTDYGSDSDF